MARSKYSLPSFRIIDNYAKDCRVLGSAQPPAKKTAGQIEKET